MYVILVIGIEMLETDVVDPANDAGREESGQHEAGQVEAAFLQIYIYGYCKRKFLKGWCDYRDMHNVGTYKTEKLLAIKITEC